MTQSALNEESFAQYLKGYVEVTPEDIASLGPGGRLRYIIETDDGERKYRLGGVVLSIDSRLRYLRCANTKQNIAWSVQLQTPGQRVKLFYMPPGTTDEIATMRTLLDKIESGDITIRKNT